MARPASPIVLAATLHDAEGKLAGEIRRQLPRLLELYQGVVVATSPPTAPSVRRELERAGVHAGSPTMNTRGPLYRRAFRAALEFEGTPVHYLDFDRALHWVRSTGDELPRVLRVASRHELLLIGRTERAHRSHQRPLYATEAVANRLLATRLGFADRVDFLVPSFVATPVLARRLLGRSRARGAGIYGEWAALLATLDAPITYLECRGLDWETPDRFPQAVRRVGLDAWRAGFDSPAEWALRTALAKEIVRVFSRTIGSRPAPANLHRIATMSGRPGMARL